MSSFCVRCPAFVLSFSFFFFNDTATTEIYTLSLHDALPIYSSITPPAYVASLVALARARGVKLQVGTTNGGNDGSVFTDYGAVDVALGWPLRSSHSPAELVDLKDVASLADLIQAAAEAW